MTVTCLTFGEPPARANAVFNDEVIAQLRARPREWALVRTYKHHGRSCSDFTSRPFEIEIKVRHINSHKPTGRCELWARWIPGGMFA